ncbi:MAG: hypothetical protein KBD47_01000 [Candidatus Pacebacteria bacterium]|jgi:hypothetical protein|nr:hypothetical protein [Candidatus Paceibacterota bacterium]
MKPSLPQLMNLRNRLKNIGIILLILIIVGYSLYTARNLIRGPVLTIYEPADGAIIATTTVILRGYAPNAKIITLNDQPILIDEQGNFGEIRLLEKGENVYKLFIKDRFNRENQKILRIFRQATF